ncbi:CE1759 family FMN reductase [Brachybacterium hainanense]|uniref:CE1759 family FMN reductase n=1 Tax=Brachybacterium hainanense TaxID=1541174 RepID=A0ABV6R6P1_9MICO
MTTSSPTRLLVLSAGMSTPSSTRMLADQLAGAARRRLEAEGRTVEVRTVELREIAHEILDLMLTRFPGERMGQVLAELRAADAVIAVTPIFNTAASGLFKSFLDAVDPDLWKDLPVMLGATAGTARHSLALEYAIRPIFAYLRAEVVPTAVFAASSDFGAAEAGEGADAPLSARADRAAAELARLLGDRAPAPQAAPAVQAPGLDAEFADFVPMGQLLGR